MPIYRFRCRRCGYEFRELVPYNNEDGQGDVRCPHCGSGDTQRLLPRFGVIYKGSGFYTTEYRRKREGGSSEGSGSASGTSKKES